MAFLYLLLIVCPLSVLCQWGGQAPGGVPGVIPGGGPGGVPAPSTASPGNDFGKGSVGVDSVGVFGPGDVNPGVNTNNGNVNPNIGNVNPNIGNVNPNIGNVNPDGSNVSGGNSPNDDNNDGDNSGSGSGSGDNAGGYDYYGSYGGGPGLLNSPAKKAGLSITLVVIGGLLIAGAMFIVYKRQQRRNQANV